MYATQSESFSNTLTSLCGEDGVTVQIEKAAWHVVATAGVAQNCCDWSGSFRRAACSQDIEAK